MPLNITHGPILAVFFQATAAEVQHGRRWYDDAREFCQNLASQYSLSVEATAGVVAALSPNNRWERNLTDAENICRAFSLGSLADAEQCKVATFNANKAKALQILAGSAPLAVLGGLKVQAFYRCILGNSINSVCVDGHAYAIWRGEHITTTKTPKISPKLYAAIAADYARAAETINGIIGTELSAAQVQAITWCAWRRITREK